MIGTLFISEESDESLRDNDKSKRKNGRVVIWSVEESRPKFELIGHKGHVNGVAWHPRDPTMLVSCGDDSTIRVWSLNRSETSDYSQVIPRRIPRSQKKQKTEPKVTEPVLNTKQELMRSLREQIKNMSTKNDFETDLKMEQLWIQRANQPKWTIDEEVPQTM